MLRLQRILCLVLCFFVCLIVCVLPVSANDYDFSDGSGIITLQRQLFRASSSGGLATYFFDSRTSQFSLVDCTYTLDSGVKTINDPSLITGYYIDFTFSIPESGVLSFVDDNGGSYFGGGLVDSNNAEVLHDFNGTDEILITVFVDDVQKQLLTSAEYIAEESYSISHHLRIRISSNFTDRSEFEFYDSNGNERGRLLLDFVLDAVLSTGGSGSTDPTTPTNPDDPDDPDDPDQPGSGGGSADFTEVVDQIKIVQGHLEEINGNIVDIKDSVDEIKLEIQDTKDQLEDPSSPIWSAAGDAIGNTIESLFVPKEEDIAEVKQGFDDLAKDKLGGAYTAMETVEDTIGQVNDKLNNPSAAEGIPFPGISVPLGGEVGLVTLVPEQLVTLPTQLTAVLHPVAGTIISIICALGTFNVLKDMVECFLSGYSYSEFLHRGKGGSDE